jgi:hypothetical protein
VDFEARRLRVQLPCGSQTLVACIFGTCRLPSIITCIYRTPFCPTWGSFCPAWESRWCEIGTRPPTFPTTVTCGGTFTDPTSPIYDNPELVQARLEVEELDLLREQLEAQLKEVVAAQAAVTKANKSR